MPRDPVSTWMKLANDSYWLWAESLMVMGMRTTDMMTGKGSDHENKLMVAEKVKAGAELAAKLTMDAATGMMNGQLPSPEHSAQKAVSHYRKRVTANRKRLSRRKRS